MLDYVAATSHGFDPTLRLYAAYSYALRGKYAKVACL
jgi:hypothetical protein